MHPSKITSNLPVSDIDAAKGFYTDFLGLEVEEFNLGWVARFTHESTGANAQLLTKDAGSPVDSVISVHTPDVEAAYEEAQRRGYEIVLALKTEAWGVRRFFVRDPDGNVINILQHAD